MSGKKITRSDMIGQAGVNLIATAVNRMGFLWHPTNLEAGIDGLIEIRDPATGVVTNSIVQVQSRATEQAFLGESDEGFDYLCEERDLAYWLAGNAPVIFIRSRPSTGDAFWISLKDYFRTLALRKKRRIHFNKRHDRFDETCAAQLAGLAIPKDSGLYLTRLPRTEFLLTNLLEVSYYPQRLFRAQTEFRKGSELWRRLKEITADPASEWILADGCIYSFFDLTFEPWSKICDIRPGKATNLATRDFSHSGDTAQRNLFVKLLNKCLRSVLKRDHVEFDSQQEFYYFAPGPKLKARKCNGRTVFSGHRSKNNPEHMSYYRHTAFHAQFQRFGDRWYLEITPTYFFTFNGRIISRFHEDALSGIKLLEKQNKTHLAQVRLWADLLTPNESLYDDSYRFLKFGTLQGFEVDFGIDDAAWLPKPKDAEIGDPQRRMFCE